MVVVGSLMKIKEDRVDSRHLPHDYDGKGKADVVMAIDRFINKSIITQYTDGLASSDRNLAEMLKDEKTTYIQNLLHSEYTITGMPAYR
jgi:hypothetical protein